MKLKEITYMILEELRNNNIVDDENLDLRLIEAWVHLKRATFLRQKNYSERVNLNNQQELLVPLEKVVSYNIQSAYPFLDTSVQDYNIWQSIDNIPSVIENARGPMVLSVMTTDKMKLPLSFVEYDAMKVSGNGRFNSNFIYGSLRNNKLYFKPNSFFDLDNTCIISAVFNNPTEVSGFNIDEDDYPCSSDIIEAIKNSIFDKDFRVILMSQSDTENDSSSDGIREEN